MTKEALIKKIALAQAMLKSLHDFGIHAIRMDGVYMYSENFYEIFKNQDYEVEENHLWQYPGMIRCEIGDIIIKALLTHSEYEKEKNRKEETVDDLRSEIEALKAEIEEMEQRHDEELKELREDYEEQIRDYCIPIPQERLVGISDRDFV